MFTQESLGITAYIVNRELEFTYTTNPEKFKKEFESKINLTVPLNLLVDNLKKYIHLLSDRNDDIELLWKALRLYRTQHEQWIRKSEVELKHTYIFGPITMRALSYHNLPDYAIKVSLLVRSHQFHQF